MASEPASADLHHPRGRGLAVAGLVVNILLAIAKLVAGMHVRVAPDMTVRDAHALSHRVKDAVRDAMPGVADVLVHIEPASGPAGAR